MRVPHSEGLVSHTVPESCAVDRKGIGEALTGGAWAGLLSRERLLTRVPTLSRVSEGNTGRVVLTRPGRALRGQGTMARAQVSYAGTGRSHVRPRRDAVLARAMNPQGVRLR